MSDALNPNHGVTQEVSGQWHKLCAIIIHKYDLGDVVITSEDIEALSDTEANNIAIESKDETLTLRLVTLAEGMDLARKHGGLPV